MKTHKFWKKWKVQKLCKKEKCSSKGMKMHKLWKKQKVHKLCKKIKCKIKKWKCINNASIVKRYTLTKKWNKKGKVNVYMLIRKWSV